MNEMLHVFILRPKTLEKLQFQATAQGVSEDELLSSVLQRFLKKKKVFVEGQTTLMQVKA